MNLPYAFYNEGVGGAVAWVYGATGWPQRQAQFVATVIGGTNSALAGYLLGKDFQMPWVSRLFLDPIIALSRYGTINSYQNGNPDFRGQQAGTNDSSQDNYVQGTANDNFVYLNFRYLLPFGHGKEIINTYVMDRGLLYKGATGGTSWNPMMSGKTFLEFQPFARYQDISTDYGDFIRRTNGLNFTLRYRNEDFPSNPSQGNTLRLRYSEDWGWFNSTTPYNVISGEYSHYVNLGTTDRFRQRGLALDVWTADVPSWNDFDTEGCQKVFHRPPGFQGANLGGEDKRKQPVRMLGELGWLIVLRYLFGRHSFDDALQHVSLRMGLRAGVVLMPFPEAAVDVDSVSDWDVARSIAARAGS